jgi:hypothetical protein
MHYAANYKLHEVCNIVKDFISTSSIKDATDVVEAALCSLHRAYAINRNILDTEAIDEAYIEASASKFHFTVKFVPDESETDDEWGCSDA